MRLSQTTFRRKHDITTNYDRISVVLMASLFRPSTPLGLDPGQSLTGTKSLNSGNCCKSLLELPGGVDSHAQLQHMFYKEIQIHVSFILHKPGHIRILSNSNFSQLNGNIYWYKHSRFGMKALFILFIWLDFYQFSVFQMFLSH